MITIKQNLHEPEENILQKKHFLRGRTYQQSQVTFNSLIREIFSVPIPDKNRTWVNSGYSYFFFFLFLVTVENICKTAGITFLFVYFGIQSSFFRICKCSNIMELLSKLVLR